MKQLFIACILLVALAACNNGAATPDKVAAKTNPVPVINYILTGFFPHDTSAYTEGFLMRNGVLYEGTGSPEDLPFTQSIAGPVDMTTGKINKKVALNRSYFGEGIVFLHDKFYQLTYKKKKGFVYDAADFKLLDSFSFASKEGWGLTTDSTSLIMSDGTCNISYINPADFTVSKVLRVTDDNGAVDQINELEYVHGFLYANIYTTTDIVKIDTQTGRVVGRLDCSSLNQKAKALYPGALEMNGIAWDASRNIFYVTGKMWPNIYAISFQH